MAKSGTIADADGDIAALVYTSADRPDLVLCAFAQYLTENGHRVGGLIQLRDHASEEAPRRVMVLESRQVVEVRPKPEDNCSLDAHWLDEMAVRSEAMIRSGVDAVIVNRFGPLEAAGRGFSEAIRVAWETRTPLIVAVPAFEFDRWTRFSSGMTVKLDCTLGKALDWWHRVAVPSPPAEMSGARACELLK